jgi:hypothetical protein
VRNDDEDTLANLIAVQGSHTPGYHGHDAVLHARLQDEAGVEPVVVRIIGGSHRPVAPQLSVGAVVTLRARGPVFAWPAD